MANYVSISYDETMYGRWLAHTVTHRDGDSTFHFDLAKIPGFPPLDTHRRRRADRRDAPLPTILPTDIDNPFLDLLFATFAPRLLDKLASQLPALHADLHITEEDPETGQ